MKPPTLFVMLVNRQKTVKHQASRLPDADSRASVCATNRKVHNF
jgi:hypothetical protein